MGCTSSKQQRVAGEENNLEANNKNKNKSKFLNNNKEAGGHKKEKNNGKKNKDKQEKNGGDDNNNSEKVCGVERSVIQAYRDSVMRFREKAIQEGLIFDEDNILGTANHRFGSNDNKVENDVSAKPNDNNSEELLPQQTSSTYISSRQNNNNNNDNHNAIIDYQTFSSSPVALSQIFYFYPFTFGPRDTGRSRSTSSSSSTQPQNFFVIGKGLYTTIYLAVLNVIITKNTFQEIMTDLLANNKNAIGSLPSQVTQNNTEPIHEGEDSLHPVPSTTTTTTTEENRLNSPSSRYFYSGLHLKNLTILKDHKYLIAMKEVPFLFHESSQYQLYYRKMLLLLQKVAQQQSRQCQDLLVNNNYKKTFLKFFHMEYIYSTDKNNTEGVPANGGEDLSHDTTKRKYQYFPVPEALLDSCEQDLSRPKSKNEILSFYPDRETDQCLQHLPCGVRFYMEYNLFGTLEDFLKNQNPLNPSPVSPKVNAKDKDAHVLPELTARAILYEVLLGLLFLHKNGNLMYHLCAQTIFFSKPFLDCYSDYCPIFLSDLPAGEYYTLREGVPNTVPSTKKGKGGDGVGEQRSSKNRSQVVMRLLREIRPSKKHQGEKEEKKDTAAKGDPAEGKDTEENAAAAQEVMSNASNPGSFAHLPKLVNNNNNDSSNHKNLPGETSLNNLQDNGNLNAVSNNHLGESHGEFIDFLQNMMSNQSPSSNSSNPRIANLSTPVANALENSVIFPRSEYVLKNYEIQQLFFRHQHHFLASHNEVSFSDMNHFYDNSSDTNSKEIDTPLSLDSRVRAEVSYSNSNQHHNNVGGVERHPNSDILKHYSEYLYSSIPLSYDSLINQTLAHFFYISQGKEIKPFGADYLKVLPIFRVDNGKAAHEHQGGFAIISPSRMLEIRNTPPKTEGDDCLEIQPRFILDTEEGKGSGYVTMQDIVSTSPSPDDTLTYVPSLRDSCVQLHTNALFHKILAQQFFFPNSSQGGREKPNESEPSKDNSSVANLNNINIDVPIFCYTSLPHCAPEVLNKKRFSEKSDIYSFGMTLLQCFVKDGNLLCGEVFEGIEKIEVQGFKQNNASSALMSSVGSRKSSGSRRASMTTRNPPSNKITITDVLARTVNTKKEKYEKEEKILEILNRWYYQNNYHIGATNKESEVPTKTKIKFPSYVTLSDEVKQIIERCLHPDAYERPSAADLLKYKYFLFGDWILDEVTPVGSMTKVDAKGHPVRVNMAGEILPDLSLLPSGRYTECALSGARNKGLPIFSASYGTS